MFCTLVCKSTTPALSRGNSGESFREKKKGQPRVCGSISIDRFIAESEVHFFHRLIVLCENNKTEHRLMKKKTTCRSHGVRKPSSVGEIRTHPSRWYIYSSRGTYVCVSGVSAASQCLFLAPMSFFLLFSEERRIAIMVRGEGHVRRCGRFVSACLLARPKCDLQRRHMSSTYSQGLSFLKHTSPATFACCICVTHQNFG